MKIPDLNSVVGGSFLGCITAGVVGTIGTGIEIGVILNLPRDYWYFTGDVTVVGLAILFGVAIGVLFGVSLYKDELVLPKVRKHMLLYWMYWIVLGGAFALIGSIPLILLELILLVIRAS